MPITLAQAREELRALGLTISKNDGEYRVNLKGGTEDTAYYTNDLTDAISTGKFMAAPEKAAPRRRVQCVDCGKVGERTGHQDCQFPQDRAGAISCDEG